MYVPCLIRVRGRDDVSADLGKRQVIGAVDPFLDLWEFSAAGAVRGILPT